MRLACYVENCSDNERGEEGLHRRLWYSHRVARMHQLRERGAEATHATRKCACNPVCSQIDRASSTCDPTKTPIVRNNSTRLPKSIRKSRLRQRVWERIRRQDEQATGNRSHNDLHENFADALQFQLLGKRANSLLTFLTRWLMS